MTIDLTHYNVRVYNDHVGESWDYHISAPDGLTARMLAFILNAGHEGDDIDEGIWQLALTYTEIVE